MKKTVKRRGKTIHPSIIYTESDYNSNDGMLTSVWGPGMWHYLHTMSFNYPIKPTNRVKIYYRNFILNLKYTLPCGKCRVNLCNNLKKLPILVKYMKNRDTFSKYIYDLHELINEMLNKKSGLTYAQVRERYEHFRSRCSIPKNKTAKRVKFAKNIIHEKGCTEPLYGEKSKCILKIVPMDNKCKSLEIDEECIKTRNASK
jgi:hypothetical protein